MAAIVSPREIRCEFCHRAFPGWRHFLWANQPLRSTLDRWANDKPATAPKYFRRVLCPSAICKRRPHQTSSLSPPDEPGPARNRADHDDVRLRGKTRRSPAPAFPKPRSARNRAEQISFRANSSTVGLARDSSLFPGAPRETPVAAARFHLSLPRACSRRDAIRNSLSPASLLQ